MSTDTTNPYLMALMPLSQATSWSLIIASRTTTTLYPNILGMSSFYCAWALYKKFIGDKNEKGHISMGLAALAAATHSKWPTVATVSLVILNFAAVTKFILVDTTPQELANLAKKSVTWARLFKGYFVSSILFWSTVLYKVLTVES